MAELMLKNKKIGDGEHREKRIKSSIPCNLDFLNVHDSLRDTPSEAMAVNISKRGVGLITNVQVYAGDIIEISLQVNPKDPIRIEGKALWCKEASPGEFRVGIIFNAPFPLNRLPAPLEKKKEITDFDELLKTGNLFAGKYNIEKVLGKGGMGTVLKVTDTILNEKRAIKILLPNHKGIPLKNYQLFKELFIIEARNSTRIAPHRNLIRVFTVDFTDIGEIKDIPYIVMAYEDGEALKDWMKYSPIPCRLKICYRFIEKICEALSVAHEVTVHRDLKPENIIISKKGEPIVLDFGVSTFRLPDDESGDPYQSASKELNRAIVGTPKYRPPEQLNHNIKDDLRADVYSFAIVIYEMLTGEFPDITYETKNRFKSAVSMENVRDPSEINPQLFPQLDKVILKAMSLDREARYKSISDFSNAFIAALEAADKTAAKGFAIKTKHEINYEGMVMIEEGDFWLGSGKESRLKQEKGHRVFLHEYYLDVKPVTNKEYKIFLDETEYWKPAFWNVPRFNKPDYPVVGVSWHDAVKYAEWAGKSLPTEAEWEKAAKKDKKLVYPWGDEFDPMLANIAHQEDGTTAVGGYPGGASPNGCLDMIGNVNEWCMDWYDPNAYSKRDWKNPKAPPKNSNVDNTKVLRGASWSDSTVYARSAYRFHKPPDARENYIGFRCARKKALLNEERPIRHSISQDHRRQNEETPVGHSISQDHRRQEAIEVIDICDSAFITSKYGNFFYNENFKKVLADRTRNISQKHNKKFIKSTGDGFLITFNKAEEAINSAIELLRSVEDYNKKFDEDEKRMYLRISINFGEVIVESDEEDKEDRIGDRVNMAFRLDSVNPENFSELPGGLAKDELPKKNRIFVTEFVYSNDLEEKGIKFRLLGLFKAKGIGGFYKIYEVLWK